MNAGTMIEIRDMHKVYGRGEAAVEALRGVSMRVEKGEFVAVMGPSGSGKSTLMNVLGCLDRPTSGTYVLDGQDVSHMSKEQLADVRNQEIGFVFQSYQLLPRTSAVKNVMLPLLYKRTNHESEGEMAARALNALSAVGLLQRAEHRPNELSGGQQQRVAIARALINDPAIILADEPTGNLDSRAGEEIMDLLGKLHEEGHTIVMVTHDQQAAKHAGRIIRLHDGCVAAQEENAEEKVQ
jgi:putative ABC transport system ATP-binding protein